MKIYLVESWTRTHVHRREDLLRDIRGGLQRNFLCTFAPKYRTILMDLIWVKKEVLNENILGGEGRKKRA